MELKMVVSANKTPESINNAKLNFHIVLHMIQFCFIIYLFTQLNNLKNNNLNLIKDGYAKALHSHDFSPIGHTHSNKHEHDYADVNHNHQNKADHTHSADEVMYKTFRTLDKVINDLEFHNHWAEEIMYQSVIYGVSGRTVQEALRDAARYNHTHKVSELK